MKQQYQSKQNSQNDKFNRQLNHLQGVVGLANWQFSSPTQAQMKAYEQEARRLHARESSRVIHGVITTITRGLATLSSYLVSEIKRRHLRRKGIARLQQLNDHMLKDIGITRGDVMALAKNKVSSDEINAQRYGRRAVTTPVVATTVQQPARKDTQRFSANDPHHLQECA